MILYDTMEKPALSNKADATRAGTPERQVSIVQKTPDPADVPAHRLAGPRRRRVLHAALLVYALLFLGYLGLWLGYVGDTQAQRSDYNGFYAAWLLVRDGHGAELYNLALQERYQDTVWTAEYHPGTLLAFLYPPHAGALLAPLGFLPRFASFLVWTGIQAGLLVWLLRLLWQFAHDWQPIERWLLAGWVLAFPATLITFLQGAFSVLITLCTFQLYCTLKQGREEGTGFWLALGTMKPQLMLLPTALLLGAGRWRALGSGLVYGGILFVASSVALAWHIWWDFAGSIGGFSSLFSANMHNLRGTLTLLLGSEQSSLISTLSLGVLVLVLLATVVWWGRQRWQPAAPTFEARFALTLLLGVLFSPHLHPHDGLVLLVPVVLFYAYLRQHAPGQWVWYGGFVLLWPLLFLVGQFFIGDALPLPLAVLAMLVLAGWIGVALWRARGHAVLPAEREAGG